MAIPYQSPSTNSLIAVIMATSCSPNPIKLARVITDIEPVSTSIEQGSAELDQWNDLKILIDTSCSLLDQEDLHEVVEDMLCQLHASDQLISSPLSIWPSPPTYQCLDIRQVSLPMSSSPSSPSLTAPSPSSPNMHHQVCKNCKSPLESKRAIEVGHTFYLGSKYSRSFEAGYRKPVESSPAGSSAPTQQPQPSTPDFIPFEMGCHGIGISRLLGAIAECCQTDKGLLWPPNVSPYKVCFVHATSSPSPSSSSSSSTSHANTKASEHAQQFADHLEQSHDRFKDDVLVDERLDKTLGWKLNDAQIVGYPVIVVVGNHWYATGKLEVRDTVSSQTVFVEPGQLSNEVARILDNQLWGEKLL